MTDSLIDQQDDNGSSAAAAQACAACRRGKRKCDKSVPACGLCTRLGRECVYVADEPPSAAGTSSTPSAEEFEALKQQVADLTNLFASQQRSRSTPSSTNGSMETNVVNGSGTESIDIESSQSSSTTEAPRPPNASDYAFLFLDSHLCEYQRPRIQRPYVKVPPGALACLGNAVELRAMTETYFTTVHTYFPIISKIRLYQHLSNPTHEPDAPIALLFLAMKLIGSNSSDVSSGGGNEDSPYTRLYHDVKGFYNYVEAQNGLCVQSIQALLLIALYEMGHGIYPAAYLTVGHAARVAYAVGGLHDSTTGPSMLAKPITWTEQEERRRLWWGIVTMDRFINIGHRGTPFVTTEPGLETHLPTDDAAWDRGEMIVAAPLVLSASPSVAASPFARTCQATHLLGKALRNIDDHSVPSEYAAEEAVQLHRTMHAFVDAVLQSDDHAITPNGAVGATPGPLLSSLAVAYSGLLTLYDSYSCTGSRPFGGEGLLVMQEESIAGLRNVSGAVFELAEQLDRIIAAGGIETVNPMVIDCVYQAAANYAWYLHESSEEMYATRLRELKGLLTAMNRRWKVAGEYLRIVSTWQGPIRADS